MRITKSDLLLFFCSIVVAFMTYSVYNTEMEYRERNKKTFYHFTIIDSSMVLYDEEDNYIGSTQLSGNIDSLLVDYYE
jgi:hypothetical protein